MTRLPVLEITNARCLMTQNSTVLCPRNLLLKNVVRAVKCWYSQRIHLMILSDPSSRDVKTLSHRPWSLKGGDQSRISLLRSNHTVYSVWQAPYLPIRADKCGGRGGDRWSLHDWYVFWQNKFLGHKLQALAFWVSLTGFQCEPRWWFHTYLLSEAESFLRSWQVFS